MKWVRGPRTPQPGRLRLFCLPHAGGTSSIFNGWDAHITRHAEVWQVLLPGRGTRIGDEPITDAREMTHALAEGLAPHMHAPFAIFGHSMGAMLAHELTMHLLSRGGPVPRLLVVSGRQAPHLPAVLPPVRSLTDEQFLQVLGGMSTETTRLLSDPSLRKVLMPLLRADFLLCDSWSPRAVRRIPVPILAFGGTRDPSLSASMVEQWGRHTFGRFNSIFLPGDHFLVQPLAKDMCAAIEDELGHTLCAGSAGAKVANVRD
ncbi:MAG TPA: alpha/beta fold hydrolase [Steroidobacteraceae bacterium]|nr:alpha/beta fold hydrolase [Steroidobacteraceae bacterium]